MKILLIVLIIALALGAVIGARRVVTNWRATVAARVTRIERVVQ